MAHVNFLLYIMERLRDRKSGCDWDLAQNFESVAPYTIEEAYEVADAIAKKNYKALCDELGDLLLQVVFHARMAEELEEFDFNDVVDAIVKKMIRRHPHVFSAAAGEMEPPDWESMKLNEREVENKRLEQVNKLKTESRDIEIESSVLDNITAGLPAMLRAIKLQKAAAKTNFDWDNIDGVFNKVDEELDELKQAIAFAKVDPEYSFSAALEKSVRNVDDNIRLNGDPGAEKLKQALHHELGDVLFSVINLARHIEVNPEQALVSANARFEQRFRLMEEMASKEKLHFSALSESEKEALWCQAKEHLKNSDH